ncbi:MAG: sigma-70 family RNA polymerase sigma factor [Gemmatimonadaceae bacterium]|nr:sigma-70 family RNA polymerase sigma factor [Gemmatimonadaceae bacterium]
MRPLLPKISPIAIFPRSRAGQRRLRRERYRRDGGWMGDSTEHDDESRAPHDLSAISAELLTQVYPALRTLAGQLMRRERAEHTLQPTALAHEAILRLLGQHVEFRDSRHALGVAVEAMRRILVDHARRRGAGKRNHGTRVELHDSIAEVRRIDEDVVAVDEALARLAKLDARQARVVELRYFAGFSIDETAATLDVSSATVRRDWVLAKAWLQREIGDIRP